MCRKSEACELIARNTLDGMGYFVLYRFAFWSVIGIPAAVAGYLGLLTIKTPVPTFLLHLIQDWSSLWLFVMLLVMTVIVAGTACLLPVTAAKRVLELSLNDAPKIFVDLAMFTLWLSIVAACTTRATSWFGRGVAGSAMIILIVIVIWCATEWIKLHHCAFQIGDKLSVSSAIHESVDIQGGHNRGGENE
jgi:hypothetical protein